MLAQLLQLLFIHFGCSLVAVFKALQFKFDVAFLLKKNYDFQRCFSLMRAFTENDWMVIGLVRTYGTHPKGNHEKLISSWNFYPESHQGYDQSQPRLLHRSY
jgi:hypothetical protein